jgi:hypothetical protein
LAPSSQCQKIRRRRHQAFKGGGGQSQRAVLAAPHITQVTQATQAMPQVGLPRLLPAPRRHKRHRHLQRGRPLHCQAPPLPPVWAGTAGHSPPWWPLPARLLWLLLVLAVGGLAVMLAGSCSAKWEPQGRRLARAKPELQRLTQRSVPSGQVG